MSGNHLVTLAKGLLLASAAMAASVSVNAGVLTDPVASVANAGADFILRKELSGFGNYGALDDAADILYRGDSGSWSFDLGGAGVTVGAFNTAIVTYSLSLDDHGTASSLYAMTASANGNVLYAGDTDSLGITHGSNFSSTFSNWEDVDFTTTALADPFVVSLSNDSTGGQWDWIAIDYVEVRLTNASAVPNPASALMMVLGLAVFRATARRR